MHLGLGRLMGTKRERRHPLPSETWAGPISSKRRAASFQRTNATGVARRKVTSGAEKLGKLHSWVGLEGGGMIDEVQRAYLFYNLVSRSNHKPEILFHLPSRD